MSRILISGAGGFIGHHLVKRLKAEGHWVRGVDLKLPEWEASAADDFLLADLRNADNAYRACTDVDAVYHLAYDMGGMGFLQPHSLEQRASNTRIDLNMTEAAGAHRQILRFFYASSACVYNDTLQANEDAPALKEEDAYPAHPDLSYGWCKLMGEQALAELALVASIRPFVARFHNVYGELGTYDGGREKAPAALCRKIALAKLRGDDSISVWGDGLQQRSFMYIDDCIDGILRLTASDHHEPINLGRDEQVSIDELALLIMDIADWHVRIDHDLSKPQGVRSRNSNNARLREVLHWQPEITLHDGLTRTYEWIERQVNVTYAHSELQKG